MNAILIVIPLIAILVLRLFMSKTKNSPKEKDMDDFWEREHEAKFARNKDISNIELFSPDISQLPFSNEPSGELLKLESNVKLISKEPMLDLHMLSNTDIRIKYGPANFPVISKYDQNFLYFTRDLFQWSKYLYNNNQHEKAQIVLEYLITLSQNTSGAYTMLGTIYKENDEPAKITELMQTVENSTIYSKQVICDSLREIINSY